MLHLDRTLPAAALALVLFAASTTLARNPKQDYGKVELLRDRWGVPHVFAETDEGAMFGLGYAAAEDRGFQMHYTLRIIQGRLAEVIGDVQKTRRRETAVDNDRKMRTFGFAAAADRLVDNLDPESRGLLEAYAAGVNAWFDANAEDLHPLFAKTGLVPEPWTAADCLLSWWHLAQFFATDGTRDLMRYRNLVEGNPRDAMLAALKDTKLEPLGPDDAAAVVKRSDVTDEWIEKTRAFLRENGFEAAGDGAASGQEAGPKFSHAWVADGKVTGTGSAVLVSMPQTPVANPPLLYEFHISGKTFNARGVGVAGSPVILIGWNEHVAWGMTALGADQADLFRLKTDPARPGEYYFDGTWRKMETADEEIKVKGGPAQTLSVRRTHLGPVANEFCFARPGDPLVALKRIPVCETDRETIQGAVAMLRAKDAGEFFEALAGWRFPTANVLFGDKNGRIGFSAVGALVLRASRAPEGGAAAHDGSASEYDWRGVVPQGLVPHVLDPASGILFSGNHRPIASFYPIPIGISTGSMGDTLRSLRLRQLLEGREQMTPDEIRKMIADSVNPARVAIVRAGYHLRDVLGEDLAPEALDALAHLELWHACGGPSDLDTPGAELAMHLGTMFRIMQTDLAVVYGGGESGLARFVKTLNRRLDADPEAPIEPLEREFIENALADAWIAAERAYGGDPLTWNDTARREVTQRRLGYYESLDGFPSLDEAEDVRFPALRCVDGGTLFSQAAQAYVQWVPLADVDAAQSLLPPGNSERPGAPFRTVNMQGWQNGELHPAPLTREAVEAAGGKERGQSLISD